LAQLSPRRQAVLALVVQEYITTAQPVGSKAVVEGYGLKLSSATIRNEMKTLEEQGYLTHPHTSAGRVPTEEGYRFFVEHLLPEHPLPMDDQLMIQHQFYQVRQELDQWTQLAAAVLAHTSRMGALATPMRFEAVRFKHLELVEVRNGLTLLVLVLHRGLVRQQMLTLGHLGGQDELSQLSNQLNDLLAGKGADEIDGMIMNLSPVGRQVVDVIHGLMAREDHMDTDLVYREGLSHMLTQPEFASIDDMQQVLAMLEQTPLLGSVFEGVRQQEGVQVLIGGEGRYDTLRDLSLVLSRYGIDSGGAGVLGVVGPVRMPYGRVIPLVRYVAHLLNDMVSGLYG
jgi:heat-inducible transcriptional repressor